MEPPVHIRALQHDGELLAIAADRAGLLAPVPSCPGWEVRDLLRHIGYVHSWATGYVRAQRPEMTSELTEAEQLRAGPADSDLIGWFLAGHAELVGALSAADPAMYCWTFLDAPSPLAFWARRQAHETAIHRADAELAGGHVTPFSADFAADGIDELLLAFFGRDQDARAADSEEQRPAAPRQVLLVRAADIERDWRIALSPSGTRVISTSKLPAGAGASADCTVAGPASALYLLLWNRSDSALTGINVEGDDGLLTAWQAGIHVTWA